MKVASAYPALFRAYIAVSPLTHFIDGETISYNYVLNQAQADNNSVAVSELQSIGLPPYDSVDKIRIERKWLTHYGGDIYNTSFDANVFTGQVLGGPEYNLCDALNFQAGANLSVNSMFSELQGADLFTEVPSISIPMYFLDGRHDYLLPSSVTETYFNALSAPQGKTWIWFENSAHFLPYEENTLFQNTLINTVLTETPP